MLSKVPLSEERVGEEAAEVQQERGRGRPRNTAMSRIHVSLPEELSEKLTELQRETYATSLAEVIKNALLLYAALLEEHKEGRQVYTEAKSGGDRQRMAIFL